MYNNFPFFTTASCWSIRTPQVAAKEQRCRWRRRICWENCMLINDTLSAIFFIFINNYLLKCHMISYKTSHKISYKFKMISSGLYRLFSCKWKKLFHITQPKDKSAKISIEKRSKFYFFSEKITDLFRLTVNTRSMPKREITKNIKAQKNLLYFHQKSRLESWSFHDHLLLFNRRKTGATDLNFCSSRQNCLVTLCKLVLAHRGIKHQQVPWKWNQAGQRERTRTRKKLALRTQESELIMIKYIIIRLLY